MDKAVKVLIMLFILILMVMLVYYGFFVESELSEKMIPVLISGGGIPGAFYLYTRWRLFELIERRAKERPDLIDRAVLKRALSPFPGVKMGT